MSTHMPMTRMSFLEPPTDGPVEDYLQPQDLLPHSAPSADQDKIAPWLSSMPPSDPEIEPPTPPAKQLFGFAHKASITSFASSTTLRTSRPSDTLSIESGSIWGDSLRPQDAHKAKSSSGNIFTNLIRKTRSHSRLRPPLRLAPSSADVPPLPSPDYIPYSRSQSTLHAQPPSPPPPLPSASTPSKYKRPRGRKNVPPTPPPKDRYEQEITLDTDLDRMEGIIDLTALPSGNMNGESGSPSSGFESSNPSSGLSSDVSAYRHPPHDMHHYISPPPTTALFSNPFQPSALVPRKRMGPPVFDGRKVSPKSRPHGFPSTGSAEGMIEGGGWTAPESWAVEKNDDVPQYSSSDEGDHEGPGNRRSRRRTHQPARSFDDSLMGADLRGLERLFKIRIYRANNTYHITSADLDVTVKQLSKQLNKKFRLDPEREPHRLYLKEKGRERMLALTEKPILIVRRRLAQAGYDVADGLDMLGADDITFLMKFVYKSNVLGPMEEDLRLDDFRTINLTGRSLKTIPIILYSHTESIYTLNLSRNPMLEIPLDFVQACINLTILRLSNMAMKKVPTSVRSCAALTSLDLSCNRIADLDDAGLDNIPELRSLKIQNNRMEKLPWYFPRLRSLTELNISNNKFRKFPEVVSKTTTLIDLDISFNEISELPDELGELHKLETLIIVGNQVTRFPPGCCNLSSLKELDCRRNNISDISIVCTLPKVQKIKADHNCLFALELCFGPSLTDLDVSNNDITQLTASPRQTDLPCVLESLDVGHAKLSMIDDYALSHLRTLEKLRVCHNSLRCLPDSLGELTRLRELSCSNNQMYALPPTIGRLQRLEKLEAHNNSLAELPASLWECASLRILNVSSNLLGAFGTPPPPLALGTASTTGSPPTESPLMSAIRTNDVYSERKVSTSSNSSRMMPPLTMSLEKLYLGENRLSEDVLLPLRFFGSLRVLNLSFNDIQEIPLGILDRMSRLEELYLSGNGLSALPTEDLHKLTNLRVLFLNGNKLQTLPSELGKLQFLSFLDVGSNLLKYNIHNWEFDWNWNFNPNLQYLNLSGNKRFEIKPDHKAQHGKSSTEGKIQPSHKVLADFSSLVHLKVLGLMDVTVTFAPNIPEDNEDRRVRTSLTEVNNLAYGIADTLSGNLNMFDLVHPRFRNRADEAIFAMFGRSSQKYSSNRVSKYLHDNFVGLFAQQVDALDFERGDTIPDAMRRTFLKLNKWLHDYLYQPDARKPSTVSNTGSYQPYYDVASIRSGASGVVAYLRGRTLFVGNVGNSLAVVSRQGTAELLSKCHEPFERSEIQRIRTAEGWVSPKGLVNDEIDVSRSFGFYNYLPVINPRPDVFAWELSELDEFVIIGNQGLWDFVPYQTAVDIARTERGDPMIAAQKLRDFAISYGAEGAGTTMIMVLSVADMFHHGPARSRQPTVDSLIDHEAYALRRRPRRDEITNRDISRLDDEVSPPVGHVALVFTDIRNSTHLWEVNSGMPTAMVLHNNLLRRQLRFCGGYEVKTEGDAFMCSFPTALSAIWWCLSVQIQLLQLAWPLEILECEDGKEILDSKRKVIARGLSVRMGLHCGQPVCEPDPITHRMDYFGPMVNRSSRISGTAAGGQIMCSADVLREINAKIFESEPPTEQSPFQPIQAIEAIKRMGAVIVPKGQVKLKGLEVPEVLSLIYPAELAGREELTTTTEASPSVAGSRVQFSVDQMRQLAMLAIRLETLTSSRVFRALPDPNGSTSQAPEDLQDQSNPVYLYGSLNTLLPPLDKASDAELMLLLDSLSIRIENALAALTLKQIVAMNKSDGGDVSTRRHGGGMDVRALQQLLSFLQS